MNINNLIYEEKEIIHKFIKTVKEYKEVSRETNKKFNEEICQLSIQFNKKSIRT